MTAAEAAPAARRPAGVVKVQPPQHQHRVPTGSRPAASKPGGPSVTFTGPPRTLPLLRFRATAPASHRVCVRRVLPPPRAKAKGLFSSRLLCPAGQATAVHTETNGSVQDQHYSLLGGTAEYLLHPTLSPCSLPAFLSTPVPNLDFRLPGPIAGDPQGLATRAEPPRDHIHSHVYANSVKRHL